MDRLQLDNSTISLGAPSLKHTQKQRLCCIGHCQRVAISEFLGAVAYGVLQSVSSIKIYNALATKTRDGPQQMEPVLSLKTRMCGSLIDGYASLSIVEHSLRGHFAPLTKYKF